MIAKLGLLAAMPFVLAGVVFGATGVLMVDVREGEPGGHHFVIPVPLVLAQAALTFAPDEAKYVECPDFARYSRVAEKILRELERAPDGILVEVHDDGESVILEKRGDVIRVDVSDPSGETVQCRIPIKSAIKAVEAYDGRGFPTKAAVRALRRAPRGTLVHVKSGTEEVTVRLL